MTFAQAFAVLAASWMFGWTPVAAVEIENAAMKIVFAGPEEGFAVRGIVNKKTGGTRYVNSIGCHADFWMLKFRAAADGAEVPLNNRMSAHEKKVDRLPFGLRFSWLGCVLPKAGGTFDVFCDVSLPSGDAESEWRIRVANHSRAYALVATRYPHLREVAPPGKCDLLRWQSQTPALVVWTTSGWRVQIDNGSSRAMVSGEGTLSHSVDGAEVQTFAVCDRGINQMKKE